MKLRDGRTAAFRVVHLDNLRVYLTRRMLHSATDTPDDGLRWVPTHAADVQSRRARKVVPVGPGGVLLDYVPFHFGARNLFLYNLHTGRVPGYTDGQEPLVTLVVAVEEVLAAGHPCVFYDGHALNALSQCFDDVSALDELDWVAIDGRQFGNDDLDRKRRKQAEFLVHRAVPWSLVRGVAVCNDAARNRVLEILDHYPDDLHKPVEVMRAWYF